jgi:hypothetical protein
MPSPLSRTEIRTWRGVADARTTIVVGVPPYLPALVSRLSSASLIDAASPHTLGR